MGGQAVAEAGSVAGGRARVKRIVNGGTRKAEIRS